MESFQSYYVKKKSGFTTVEALTAIIILGLCTVTLFAALNVALNLVNDVRENIIASSIAEEEMEELRKSFFVTLPPYGESQLSNNSLTLLYTASAKVNIIDAYSNPNIVKVVITIEWYSRLNTSKKNIKRLATLIAKNGINSI